MYTTMRADPCLCFLERAGRPDDKAIDAEQHTGDAELGDEWVILSNGQLDVYKVSVIVTWIKVVKLTSWNIEKGCFTGPMSCPFLA